MNVVCFPTKRRFSPMKIRLFYTFDLENLFLSRKFVCKNNLIT
jgi:hypothetical protein